ncbi:MAG: aminotransferase class I/II-fold pyridoxal phosphate-dependent enzyme, partial [Acidimicrobiia bacterium]|nr:aminotransferase class I/II-fold pyridoxal phosphate-dependent enzyme [Acidimicrobiia bacterium]
MTDDRFETRAIHAGQEPDPATGAVTVPIYATSTYAQDSPGEHKGYEYSRTDNPTRHALEVALASLEGAGPDGGAVAASSGMGATALIAWLLSPGDGVVIPDDAYGGTHRFFFNVAAQSGIEVSVADMTDRAALEAAVTDATKLVWVETPTNPMLRVVDLAMVNEVAHGAGALVCVDNTFATPYLQRPLEVGCDMVMHSTTKYLGGHSDVVGGAVMANDPELTERLRYLQNTAGPVPGPFDSYLLLRGLKTLAVRMEAHCSNAQAVAGFLEGHGGVEEVYYPGLAGHPQHELAGRQMDGRFGGMVSFRPKGGVAAANAIATATRLFFLAESLGGVE